MNTFCPNSYIKTEFTFQGPTIGSRLKLEEIDRGMAGKYMCLAKNGVEEKDEEKYALIQLQVQCKYVLLFCQGIRICILICLRDEKDNPGYDKKLNDFCSK